MNFRGLGLLTDGIIATTNPLDDITSSDNAISDWIGWNRLITNGSIEIVFEFADIQKFAYLEIWTYGTSLRTTEIFFSIDGKKFTLASQISSIQRRALDAARNLPIRIPLHNATGQALKMKLNYKEQWLFLSEIYFASSEETALGTVRKATVSTRILTTITDITTTATIITSSI
ncbi:unnamed protein product, partial [Onchocerca flexuosa]